MKNSEANSKKEIVNRNRFSHSLFTIYHSLTKGTPPPEKRLKPAKDECFDISNKKHVIARHDSASVKIIDCSKQSNPTSRIGKIASECSILDCLKGLTPRNDVKSGNSFSLFPFSLSPRSAFTLAEVLITLGIIGVVAQMTIPTLMQGVQDQVTVTSLKKAYSTISQAYTMAVQENGTPDNWGLVSSGDPTGGLNILKNLSPYLKITKNCGMNSGCFPANTKYKLLDGTPLLDFDTDDERARAQLSDGTIIATLSQGDCTSSNAGDAFLIQKEVCGAVYVDINGFKGPNQWGVDFFQFYLTRNGIIPFGTSQETLHSFSAECKDKTYKGFSCAAWVLYNENLDYRKCDDLSWSGKTKCN